jgi:hypothetical protein
MSEPVGPQYGLEPTRDPKKINRLPLDSHNLVSPYDYRAGSEFGGVPGIIQPAPHVPTAAERLHMVHGIDPTDPGTEVDSVVPPELEGDFT